MTTMSTNDKTLKQLIEMARTLGSEVKPNTKLPLACQRQQVLDAIREKGVKIENSLFVRL